MFLLILVGMFKLMVQVPSISFVIVEVLTGILKFT